MTALEELLATLIACVERLTERLDAALPRPLTAPDWPRAVAWRYRKRGGACLLEPVPSVGAIALGDLKEIDAQKEKVARNTLQFLQGRPANNVLLTGARGTGKSSLIRACLNEWAAQGLRLIEVDKADLPDLPDIMALLPGRPEKFIIYCDDLSFDEGEPGYKALKSALDGSVAAAAPNALLYATSNRRHLLPDENGELHPGEAIEEKVSLSERFGLWASFYPFSQDEYLRIAAQWLAALGASPAQIAAARPEALVWALERGSRSGRVAQQFPRDYMGRRASDQPPAAAAPAATQGGPA